MTQNTSFSSNSSADIKHVSDTALWVAMFRALESERPDALFHDPYARRLAGARGVEIMNRMPYPKVMKWVMSVRTVALDRLIQTSIEQGCDTIVNMGAGLDARPYRMSLPSNLKWIELDFPEMIDLKNRELKDDKPVCHLERIGVDLSDRSARSQILEKINSESKAFAVLTEGVIMYLPNPAVAELSADLLAQTHLKFWIQDYRHGGYLQSMGAMKEALRDSPFQFIVGNWFDHFRKLGWEVERNILAWEEGRRLKRPFPLWSVYVLRFLFMRHRVRKAMRDSSGYVTFRPRARIKEKDPSGSTARVATPTSGEIVKRELEEGRDYTIENGNYVFTSLFLKERGYCCDSGCRNCPY